MTVPSRCGDHGDHGGWYMATSTQLFLRRVCRATTWLVHGNMTGPSVVTEIFVYGEHGVFGIEHRRSWQGLAGKALQMRDVLNIKLT